MLLFDGEFSLNRELLSSLIRGSVLQGALPVTDAFVEEDNAYKQHNQMSM